MESNKSEATIFTNNWQNNIMNGNNIIVIETVTRISLKTSEYK